jgi:hypothetical protein
VKEKEREKKKYLDAVSCGSVLFLPVLFKRGG